MATNRREILTQVVFGVFAAILLFWGLTDKYLWQDEAATAILADRLMKFGKPLAYDGVNLITVDMFMPEDLATLEQRTHDPKPAIDYFVQRRELKPDTTWKWQPWGQFLVAGASLKLFGHHTLGARLPFALAGLATVLLLYRLTRKYFDSWEIATISTLLLLTNTYWILHARQCRYYALSSLLLVATVAAYLRWQEGKRWEAAWFVGAAWLWFQVDYGTIWPVLGVLLLDSLLTRRRSIRQTATAGAALAAAIAPFIYLYELWGRRMPPVRGKWDIALMNLFNLNEYVLPLLLLVAAAVLVQVRWNTLKAGERHAVSISCGVVALLVAWVPMVSPDAFLRYVIMVAPLGSLLAGWLLVRVCPARFAWMAWAGAVLVIVTPLVSLPGHLIAAVPGDYYLTGVRDELSTLGTEIFGNRPDPNRMTVEYLRQHAKPTDEILINYEDLPLAFYLPNAIRGGIPAFRAEDDARTPPRYVVMRRSVDFVHKEIFEREMNRYRWNEAPVQIPDVIWGNNPDPMMWQNYPLDMTYLYLARRVD